MKKFFERNIGKSGRILRAIYGVVMVGAGIFAWRWAVWAGVILIAAGALGLFEAVRGWCLMRACGVKTKY